ncbi:hypothetical protein OFB78_30970, partial [Escherichia coli]|nr:hypothetical protein [Escherichia coli]
IQHSSSSSAQDLLPLLSSSTSNNNNNIIIIKHHHIEHRYRPSWQPMSNITIPRRRLSQQEATNRFPPTQPPRL